MFVNIDRAFHVCIMASKLTTALFAMQDLVFIHQSHLLDGVWAYHHSSGQPGHALHLG